MTLSSKITILFTAALLVAKTTFAACPAWDENTSYADGEKISYQGLDYEAVRAIPQNTPPNPSDNGWFWVESTEGCDNSVKIEADAFEVTFPGDEDEKTLLDKDGLQILRHPADSRIYYHNKVKPNGIEVAYENELETAKTEIRPSFIELSGDYYGPLEKTHISAYEVTTKDVNASVMNADKIFVKDINLYRYISKLEARIAALEAAQQ